MTVYVDELFVTNSQPKPGAERYFGNGKASCHLVADTDEELHEFAARLGLKREWAQSLNVPNQALHHYDLTPAKRALAVRLGAVELDREQWRERIKAGATAAKAFWQTPEGEEAIRAALDAVAEEVREKARWHGRFENVRECAVCGNDHEGLWFELIDEPVIRTGGHVYERGWRARCPVLERALYWWDPRVLRRPGWWLLEHSND